MWISNSGCVRFTLAPVAFCTAVPISAETRGEVDGKVLSQRFVRTAKEENDCCLARSATSEASSVIVLSVVVQRRKLAMPKTRRSRLHTAGQSLVVSR